MRLEKPERNDPCPCGSGKKFKKCCLPANEFNGGGIPSLRSMVLEKMNERIKTEQKRKSKYGDIRPIIQTDFDGYKFVAVGSGLYYSKDWKTFPDFLLDYIKRVVGLEWGQAELQKPLENRHEIMKWYDAMCRFQKKQVKGPTGLFEAVPNGPMKAYLLLSYDLYMLRHHGLLQKTLVARLLKPDQFQGARHELFAAASCVRAGLKIEYEDETDSTRKHPEFIATDETTGQKIAVEAKSRSRPGVLGHHGARNPDEIIRLRIGRLINASLSKGCTNPLVVFLDLNLPPQTVRLFEKPWIDEINKALDKIEQKSGGKTGYNLLVLSNMPFYYDVSDKPSPKGDILSIFAKQPLISVSHPKVLLAIHDAANKFGNIPNEFAG